MTKFLIISLMMFFIFFSCENKQQTRDQTQSKSFLDTKQSKDLAMEKKGYLPVVELIRLEPESPRTGDVIRAQVIVKGDSDGIIYQWSKNNVELVEASNVLKTELKRGDIISLSVTPYKGTQNGKTVSTLTYIFNYLPAVKLDSIKAKIKGNVYYYQINAVDRDGDKLTYSLRSAPQGMEINPSSGLIKWNISPEKLKEPQKTHTVVIKVSDNHGGETEEILDIMIGQP